MEIEDMVIIGYEITVPRHNKQVTTQHVFNAVNRCIYMIKRYIGASYLDFDNVEKYAFHKNDMEDAIGVYLVLDKDIVDILKKLQEVKR